MFCQKCGTQNPDTATACSSCGTAIGGGARSPSGAAGDRVKAASQDALHAFKMFATDPVGGLAAAAESLGQARALGVGITFGVVFTICVAIGLYRSPIFGMFGQPQGFGPFLQMLVVAAVPFLSLTGASLGVRKVFGGEGGLGIDAFIAGAALLPFGFVALLAGLLGAGNFEIIAALALFAVCLTILMLFAGLTRICKTSERAATLAVPLMLIVSGWLAKVIYSAMLNQMMRSPFQP